MDDRLIEIPAPSLQQGPCRRRHVRDAARGLRPASSHDRPV